MAQSIPQSEINWDRLDKTKFYVVGAGLFSGLSTCLYPMTVIKTRMQVAEGDAVHMKAPQIVKSIFKSDGIRGFYRGFTTVITGAVPSRVLFLTTLETTKAASLSITSKLNLPDATSAAISNGVAGFLSSIVSQFVFVPLDVVSQRLMVQGSGTKSTTYTGGIDAVRKILKSDGLRGLYRGFGISVITYSPTSAVWWASYGSSQRVLWRALGYDRADKVASEMEIVVMQAAGGLVAAACASFVTAPFDTVKTRLQVMSSESGNKATVMETVRRLRRENGWRGFYRGLGPRFLSMSLWGSTMIISYEYLKRFSVKKDSF